MKPLAELLEAYRRGDEAAQAELLTRVEAQLGALAHALAGRRIRTERESEDVCQSLLLAFHVKAQAGEVAFANEEALKGYLRVLIRNKLANLGDRIRAAKRGGDAEAVGDEAARQVPAHGPTASVVAATAELRRRMEGVMGEEERAILEGLLSGRGFGEIGEELGKSADAVRMTWKRARERLVARGILRPPGHGD